MLYKDSNKVDNPFNISYISLYLTLIFYYKYLTFCVKHSLEKYDILCCLRNI